MKTLTCLLFPVLLFAQNPFPDTLLLSNGKTYPCLITSIDDSKVDFLYLNNRNESLVLEAVDQLSIEDLGIVYSGSQGFTKNVDQIKEYINVRVGKLAEEQLVQQELLKMSVVSSTGQSDISSSPQLIEYQKPFEMKKWSFGILLIPYFSGTTYDVVYYSGSYPPDFTTIGYANSEINMQGQLAYYVGSNFMLTLDVTYSSSFNETNSENHNRSEYNDYDYGYKTTDGLYLFDFSFGAKYYFLKFVPGNVNIYALAGFGKQFASANADQENLYPDPVPTPIIEDNLEEYIEGLNSPWHFDFGFGAEYLFNKSLSLNSNIRFIYASISSNYDYRYISEFETRTQSIEYSNSEFITRIGLGLNFYF